MSTIPYWKSYYEKNKKRIGEYHKIWYQRNVEKNRSLRKGANARAREKIFIELGGICCKCGFSDYRALQVDHVNSDGRIDRLSIGHGNQSMLRRIKEDRSRYQLLCANCNWIKRYESRELYRKKS